jgi:hypothetical protein
MRLNGMERSIRQKELNQRRNRRIRDAIYDARQGKFDDFGAVEGEISCYDERHVCTYFHCTPEELADWRERYKEFRATKVADDDG